MEVSELITIMRTDYLDDTFSGWELASDSEKDDQFLWSDAQLTRYLAQAQEEACTRGGLITDRTTYNHDIVTGTKGYSIDQRVTKINEVSVEGNDTPTLTHVARDSLDWVYPEWRTATGQPKYFIMEGYTMYLFPTPEQDDTLTIECYAYPYETEVASTDDLQIPEGSQKNLIWYALHLAFLKRDAETYNDEASSMYFKKFELAFGPILDQRTIVHQLEQPISSFVGGTNYLTTDSNIASSTTVNIWNN